jgi:hypothetical protein
LNLFSKQVFFFEMTHLGRFRQFSSLECPTPMPHLVMQFCTVNFEDSSSVLKIRVVTLKKMKRETRREASRKAQSFPSVNVKIEKHKQTHS